MTLVVKRTIRATPARLFDAWTTGHQLLRWWGPRPVVCSAAEVDLRVGGAYRIGNRLPDGREVFITGVFEEIEVPRRLVYSWTMADHTSRVTVRFEPRGTATEVIIEHEGVADEDTRKDHEKGWIGCLDGLQRLIDEEPAARA
jgi:uncharacterized protein YndB with AHSA1/START domain